MKNERKPQRHPMIGVFKGLIQIEPATDLTAPADPTWGKRKRATRREERSTARVINRTPKLSEPVAKIYCATRELETMYPHRKFTLDGHLLGSIGEVVAERALGLKLYGMSQVGHDAYDDNGPVQIKMTAGNAVAMYADCVQLVVLRVVSPEEAEIVYDGPGAPAWEGARKPGKNGQRVVSLAKLRKLTGSLCAPISIGAKPQDRQKTRWTPPHRAS